MINNKIPIVICICLVYSTDGMRHPSTSALDMKPSSMLRTFHETEQSLDSLPDDTKTIIFNAINSVTFAKGECKSEVISNGFLVSNVIDQISGVSVIGNRIRVYFPIVPAFRVTIGENGKSVFHQFNVNGITIERTTAGCQVMLNPEEASANQPKAKRSSASEDKL